MRHQINLSHLAFTDLEAIVEYYHNLSPKVASKYYYGIMKATKKLHLFPEIGRTVPEFEEDYIDKYREILFDNYRIVYRIEKTVVHILRIIDSRRLLTIDLVKAGR